MYTVYYILITEQSTLQKKALNSEIEDIGIFLS
uniref:Uncharacterized protein n=1 Tax=Anguilla anguilla TaxID=7936 RepID=A0A0E9XD67_ANGAN